MKSIQRFVFAAIFFICVSGPLASWATSLAQGSMITAKIDQTIDSGSSHTGDQFTLTIVPPYPASNSAFAGAQLYGHVTKVLRAGQGSNPVLEFSIDRIRLANGRSAPLTLTVQAQETQKHNNVTNIGVSTLGGMIVGNIIGKTVFKSKFGGAAGAIAGALYAANKRTNVSLRRGSTVVLEAERPAII
ncbi:MAG: hypothetical protein M3Z37_05195 [Candidatus Eremiobacteraeota bacterium]|nr:hypothetical protein [Candidatus Eremiobacteraeota bacterium]